ncbi:MAG: hypothetical protein Q8P18_30695 [Pseudomonadota bacterium]|nr:hypothetical protein [Pseudomonadota bacterium]
MTHPPTLGFHLILRLQDDRVFAPSLAARRRLSRVMSGLARELPVLAWRFVDTHLHLLVLMDDTGVDALVRRLRLVMARQHPGVPLLLVRRLPVRNQWHLGEAFRYILAQDKHHGVATDPLQEGSAVLDILGMRAFGSAIALRVSEHLPRVTRVDLLAPLGVTALEPAIGVGYLLDAACAAFALSSLTGRAADVITARNAAIHAASDTTARIASALAVTVRCVQRTLVERAPPDTHVRAVRLQLALRRERAVRDAPFEAEARP